jgi:hypothetical protein
VCGHMGTSVSLDKLWRQWIYFGPTILVASRSTDLLPSLTVLPGAGVGRTLVGGNEEGSSHWNSRNERAPASLLLPFLQPCAASSVMASHDSLGHPCFPVTISVFAVTF